MEPLRLDIWSDLACPWCYVGKRRLETALKTLDLPTEIHWRAFELDPSAPREREPGSHAERIAKKYGMTVAEAELRTAQLVSTAAAEGLAFRFDRLRPGNTFDAHRLVHLAGLRGVQDAVKERLLRAYFTEGRAIGDRSVLVELACEAGLDRAEVTEVLETDRYAADVRADEAEARELGITGVPCFVIGRRFAVSGAQPPETLLAVLRQVAHEPAEGAACGPDGCA